MSHPPLFGDFWGSQLPLNKRGSHFDALVSLTENIRKNLEEGNIGCSIFVDLQKAFDTVKYILLLKLQHYGIHAFANEWFKSSLK